MYKVYLLLFIIVKTEAETSEDEAKVCDTINGSDGIVWSKTSDKTSSHPLCINSAKEIAYRECMSGMWGPEPNCSAIQVEKAPGCPDGFTEVENICYAFTRESGFPPACPFKDVLPFYSYLDVVADRINDTIWIPAKRDGLDFVRFTEASYHYREEYVNYSHTGNLSRQNCLVFDKSRKARAVSCGENHRGVCAYRNLNAMDNKVCSSLGKCCQSDYSSKTTCFCLVEETPNVSSKAEFVEIYQNSVSLTNESCNIGLEKTLENSYIWRNSKKKIRYTYWASNAEFDKDYTYGVSTPKGWVLTDQPYSCSFTTQFQEEPEITLYLSFDKEKNVFVLTIMNPSWLQTFNSNTKVFCFTDAKRDKLLHRIETFSAVAGDIGTYLFKLIEPFPGNYWCEAFKFSDLTNIQSTKLLVLEWEYLEFVGNFKVNISDENVNLLSSDLTNFLNETLLKRVDFNASDGTQYIPRIMKILEMKEESRTVIVNIHFSSIEETVEPKVESHFYELYNGIVAKTNKSGVVLRSFLNTQFCLKTTLAGLHWPTTSVGNRVSPKEFCFRTDGNVVTNFCSGTFMNGANWENSVYKCKVLNYSSITSLLSAYNDQSLISEDDIDNVLKITEYKFNSLDVYLIVNILQKYFLLNDKFATTLFEKLLEKIQNMNKFSLFKSQQITYSTDKLLNIVKSVLKTYPTQFSIFNEKFVCVMTLSNTVSGLAVQIQNGQRQIIQLRGNCTEEQVIEKTTNLEFAMFLSPQLKRQINTSRVAFSIFYNDLLFQESIFTSAVAVFGLVLSKDSDKMLPGPVVILQNTTSTNKMTGSCAKWFYKVNSIPGTWRAHSESRNKSSYLICDVWETGNFAFPVKLDDNNVTSNLEYLLEPSIVESDKISQLANISKKHHNFQPVDVLLVGKVLETIQNYSTNELTYLAEVVDNLHKVNKSVLSLSQEQHKATDLILYNVDEIVGNDVDDDETLITTDNFIVLVSHLREHNLTGLILLESNGSLKAEILRGDVTVSTILMSYDSFSSAILFSPSLKNQVGEDAKVIITVFSNDHLFNENNSNHKQVSTVFGVIFPDVETYSGPISILYNISASIETMQCSHWYYDTNNQTQSYWKKDSLVDNLSIVRKCDFWHTTHFALLLINSDKYFKYDVLDWITTINSAISLTSLVMIFLTAIFFQKWRQNIGNQILLNFSFAIILQIITFYVAGTIQRHSYDAIMCTLIGVLLHYSIISEFCWMLTIAILQFKRFVQVFAASPKYLLSKACVCGWVFPILPVMLALVLDDEKYTYSSVGLCYPSGLGLYLGVWLPIAIIGSFNFIIFIYIIYSVLYTDVDTARSGRDNGKHQWRLFILLFFMLGLTWMFGFLSGFDFGIIFAYLFCFTATLQGFVLFLYFIVFNKQTRRLYAQSIKMLFSNEKL